MIDRAGEQNPNFRHGLQKTPEYRSWMSARNRCNNPKARQFEDYGGRGIKMCSEWDDFTVFLMNMGPRPPGTSLDRKENDKGYNKDNCRWGTALDQARNRRWCHYAEIDGVRKTRSEWCQELKISERTVRNRVDREGMSLVDALTLPLRRQA